MSQTLVVARRELSEKRFIFVTAVVFSILPFLVSLSPGVQPPDRANVIGLVGCVLAVGFPLALAVVSGASAIGGELAERRMSFFLSKPLSTSAIWFGKLGASVFTAFVSLLIIFVPSLFYAGGSWAHAWSVKPTDVIALVTAGIVVLYLISHALSTMLRSRSSLLLLDALCAAAFLAAVIFLTQPILQNANVELRLLPFGLLLIIVAAVLVAGGAWQLARGRGDRVRNHIELSRFLWSSMAGVLVLIAVFTFWITHSPISSLKRIEVTVSSDGSKAVVDGLGRLNQGAAFLVDLNDGTNRRLRPHYRYNFFSHDSRHVAWLEFVDHWRHPHMELIVERIDWGSSGDGAVDTGITLDSGPVDLALSDDASRVASVEHDVLNVTDIVGHRLLAAVHFPLPEAASERLFFVTPNLLRIYRMSFSGPTGTRTQTVRVLEYDLVARQLRQTGEYSIASTRFGQLSVSMDGKRAVMRGANDRQCVLADATTLAPLAVIDTGSLPFRYGQFIGDGRLSVGSGDHAHSEVALYGVDGKLQRKVALRGYSWASILAEPVPGKLLVSALEGPEGTVEKPIVLLIDADSQTILRSEKGLESKFRGGSPWDDPRSLSFPKRDRYLFFDTAQQTIVSWDPLTGVKKKLIAS